LVDCGATTHIVNDDSKFLHIDSSFRPENHYIELGDGSRGNNVALKRGNVEICLKDSSGKIVKSVLEDALYVPSYPQNIFSVQAATAKGTCVNFFPNSANLVTKDGTKFEIEKRGKLYYLYNVSSSTICAAHSSRSCTAEDWHKILGHCNKDDVLRLEKVVDGMVVTGRDQTRSQCFLLKDV